MKWLLALRRPVQTVQVQYRCHGWNSVVEDEKHVEAGGNRRIARRSDVDSAGRLRDARRAEERLAHA